MAEQRLEDRVLAIWDTRRAQMAYQVVRRLLLMLAHPYLRTTVVGAERLRADGAFIIAPVHRSNLDGPLVNCLCPRTVRSLAKRQMFKGAAGTWMSAMLGGFPVHRGAGDRRSLKAAMDLLARGEPLLIFPEGTRQSGRQVGEIFGGTAFLASRAGVPVLPVGIAGTEEAMPPGARVPRRGPVTIVIGEPLLPPKLDSGRQSSSQRNELTIRLRDAIQSAMDEAVESASRGRRRRGRRSGREDGDQ